ncbi:MAG: hypothetical protein CXR31_12125 [Geobacter sp.]|nr:MAG: hypothetical protein CXR31_12125 [Geobacter sp.]
MSKMLLVMTVLLATLMYACTGFALQTKSPASVPAGSVADSGKNLIDLNLASREQLMTLPGIKEKDVQKIIDGRPYRMKTQLLKDSVVSTDTFYDIVNNITIDLKALDKVNKDKARKALDDRMKTGARKIRTRSGLVYQDLVPGTGVSPKDGKTVRVHYTGWLKDGTKFDSSLDRNEPFSFVIGKGKVIKGWDEGIKSMKVGGKRRLIIPPSLAYGKKGAGGGVIPPDATLIFEVELLGIE